MTKKKILIGSILSVSILIFLTFSLLIYLYIFDSVGLVYIQPNEKITDFSMRWKNFAVVSDTGNCYVAGYDLLGDDNFGVNDTQKFNNQFICKYVQIYDKGDAVSIDICSSGGTIITENNEVYIFINGNKQYRTPTYFTNGYTHAVLGDTSTIYLLSPKGDLVRANINTPTNIEIIGENIKEFAVKTKEKQKTIFALTNDNKLYIIGTDEKIENSEKYIENVTDFDVLIPYTDSCIFSILDTNMNAYVSMGNNGLTYKDFLNEKAYKKVGENITSVTSYDQGIAMLDSNGNLSIYGDEPEDAKYSLKFNSEIVFTDVKSVFGGNRCLAMIKNDGSFEQYGVQINPNFTKSIRQIPIE